MKAKPLYLLLLIYAALLASARKIGYSSARRSRVEVSIIKSPPEVVPIPVHPTPKRPEIPQKPHTIEKESKTLDLTIRYDMRLDEFIVRDGFELLIDKIATILNIPSSQVNIKNINEDVTVDVEVTLSQPTERSFMHSAIHSPQNYVKKLNIAAYSGGLKIFEEVNILDYKTSVAFTQQTTPPSTWNYKKSEEYRVLEDRPKLEYPKSEVNPSVSSSLDYLPHFYLIAGSLLLFVFAMGWLIGRSSKKSELVKGEIDMKPNDPTEGVKEGLEWSGEPKENEKDERNQEERTSDYQKMEDGTNLCEEGEGCSEENGPRSSMISRIYEWLKGKEHSEVKVSDEDVLGKIMYGDLENGAEDRLILDDKTTDYRKYECLKV